MPFLLTVALSLPLLSALEQAMAPITPVCDRTPEVRDAIMGKVPEVYNCGDVTKAHLAGIEDVLDLRGPHVGEWAVRIGLPQPISELKAGDFSGLSTLEWLALDYNQISSLPPDIFSGLSSLRLLGLAENQLTSLPEGVFSGLSSLEALFLSYNELASLPPGLFSGLSSLERIDLHGNKLTSLPEGLFSGLSSLERLSLSGNELASLPPDLFSGLSSLEALFLSYNELTSLPPDLFSGLSSLERIDLHGNKLTSLPEGLFSGLSSLEELTLDYNPGIPLPIVVSLELIGEGRVQARAHTGAPFEIVLPITVTNGVIDGGASLTIPTGSVESTPLKISRRTGTISDVTVDIESLPQLPITHHVRGIERRPHTGYALVKSPKLPLTVLEAPGLNFPHFANGESIFSDLVLVNVGTTAIRPAIYFFDTEGNPVDAESVVDVSEDLEIQEDGALGMRAELAPLGESTISTHGRGELVTGSVQVTANGPLGGFLRFDSPGLGVAGVGASPPVSDVIFPARRQEEGINTGAAIRNLTGIEMIVLCRLMQDGLVLEETEIPLAADGQAAQFIHEMFPGTDTSDFVGSVRCTVAGGGRFTGVALELDARNRIFTTLPVVPIPR